jgi:hypothetical protein
MRNEDNLDPGRTLTLPQCAAGISSAVRALSPSQSRSINQNRFFPGRLTPPHRPHAILSQQQCQGAPPVRRFHPGPNNVRSDPGNQRALTPDKTLTSPEVSLPARSAQCDTPQWHPVLRHSSHQSTPPAPNPRQPLHGEMPMASELRVLSHFAPLTSAFPLGELCQRAMQPPDPCELSRPTLLVKEVDSTPNSKVHTSFGSRTSAFTPRICPRPGWFRSG